MSQLKVDTITNEEGSGAPDFPNGLLVPDPNVFRAIGEPFAVWDHIPGVPTPVNTGPIKFIRLTAGQTGSGQYNHGLLTAESVSGSAPLVQADAEIMVGPMAGQRVPLINTEQSFLRPGMSSGALQFDQMRKHTHRFGVESSGSGGSRRIIRNQNSNIQAAASSGQQRVVSDGHADFTWAGGTDQTQFMGNEVRSKNRQATYYMRIA